MPYETIFATNPTGPVIRNKAKKPTSKHESYF